MYNRKDVVGYPGKTEQDEYLYVYINQLINSAKEYAIDMVWGKSHTYLLTGEYRVIFIYGIPKK